MAPRARRRRWTVAPLLLLVTLAALAYAQTPDADPLNLDLVGYRIVVQDTDEGPVETFSPAVAVSPGDVIEWRLEARNSSDQPVAGVSLDLPVPPTTIYLDASAAAHFVGPDGDRVALPVADLLFSADGGVTFGVAPLVRELIETVDGEEIVHTVPVPASEITHVRLSLQEFPPTSTYILMIRTEVP